MCIKECAIKCNEYQEKFFAWYLKRTKKTFQESIEIFSEALHGIYCHEFCSTECQYKYPLPQNIDPNILIEVETFFHALQDGSIQVECTNEILVPTH